MATSPLGGIASIGKSVAATRLGNTTATKPDGGVGETFGQSLMNLVENVEQSGADANQAVSNMLDKSGDVHDAMIALQRAEMTLQLTVQIRNKLVQAYQDVMRMPV
jgi:flagellar hook-basal body complex protein FliE